MSALTLDSTFSTSRLGGLFSTFEESVPVAAGAKIFGNAIVGLVDGYAVALSAFPQARVLGRAQGDPSGQNEGSTIDNTAGSAGDLSVKVQRGVFLLKNSTGVEALAETETGDLCYFVDDQTVSRHDAKGLRPLMGTFLGLDSASGGCWVQVGVGAQAQTILTGLAGEDLSSHQYGAVKLSSGGIVICGDGEKAFGILQNAPDDADVAKVCVHGPSLAKAGSAGFTTDLQVASDASGLIVNCVAAVLATPATTAIATADGSDLATTQALANAIKVKFNTLITDLTNASIIGDQSLGLARESATTGQNKMIFVNSAGLI